MKASLIKMMEMDLKAAVDDWSSRMTWGRNTVEGTFSQVQHTDTISEDGIIENIDAQFTAPLSNFARSTRTHNFIIPAIRDVVKIDGEKFWVESISKDPAGITFNLKVGE